MLALLNRKKKDSNKIYVGDKLNLIYRYKGVFFVILGIAVFTRKKSLGIYAKKNEFFLFFSLLLKNLQSVYKFDTYYFHNKKWKIKYRS